VPGASTRARIEIGGLAVNEVTGFSYSSDVMAVGDTCNLVVVNEQRRYNRTLRRGDLLKIFMRNPRVNGGAEALKFLGRVITREAETSAQVGHLLHLGCADLGWHLKNCCAELWRQLEFITYPQFLDPSAATSLFSETVHRFGFRGLRSDNLPNRLLKQGLAPLKAELASFFDPLSRVEVDAGDTIHDKLVGPLRRENKLLNVSVDGFIQVWTPNYAKPAEYQIRRRGTQSNLLEGRHWESCETTYTEVECVGEQFGQELYTDGTDPHATKRLGVYPDPIKDKDVAAGVPFVHRLTFNDPEMYREELAYQLAKWKWQQGQYDSEYFEYLVPEHWQIGPDGVARWWEPDAICDLDDEEFGVSGRYYVHSVFYETDAESGDTTRVVLRRPDLLAASFGSVPTPA
jgi:hypothetical protein